MARAREGYHRNEVHPPALQHCAVFLAEGKDSPYGPNVSGMDIAAVRKLDLRFLIDPMSTVNTANSK
jgi:hypothetical protein